jgi:hypothetical protein
VAKENTPSSVQLATGLPLGICRSGFGLGTEREAISATDVAVQREHEAEELKIGASTAQPS